MTNLCCLVNPYALCRCGWKICITCRDSESNYSSTLRKLHDIGIGVAESDRKVHPLRYGDEQVSFIF